MATNTAASFTNHTGNGSAGPFNISFSYLAEAEVDVTVGGVLKTITTHYTFTSATQITFTSGNEPANGVAIKFQRDTNISAKKVDFADGSVLTEADLDANSDQVLFAQQEIIDKLGTIEENATGDQTAAEIRTLVESASDSNVFTDADHSKLNAIEASATADQTAAEIRTLVESASDSNVFTDADHTKLNGIEASATADQTAAEIRTLVESATDSNVFTDADHTKLNSIETGATADQTNAEIRAAVEAASDSNVFTDADHSKLNAIEASATADQTASEIKTLYESNSNTNALTDAEKLVIDGVTANTSELNKLDGFTGSTADLNQVSGMSKQTTITNSDNHFPTSGAVVDFVADQIAPVGGLEVIADEDSFPATQPVSGVVISIANIDGLIVSSGGVATNARTVGSGSDNVTINNFPASLRGKTMAAELGLLVSSTGASQIYNYHKLLAKEADVEQLSNDINDFASRYRVVSSNPTSDNDAGDLIFNTSTQKLLVYNSTSGAFEEAQSVGNFFISTLSPAFNGSVQDFTITNAPSNAQQIILSINGVIQKPNAGTSTPSEGFALSGSTVKLAAAPASGSDYFAIVLGSTVNIGTPSNNTVTSAMIVDGSIVNGDISNSADIAGSKLNLVSTSSTAGVIVKGDGSSDGYLQLNCSQNSHGIKLKSPPHSANQNYTLTFPSAIINGAFLKTDANGNLSFAAVNTDLVNDTSPQLGGDLDGNDILLADNDSIKLGASNDFIMFHDSSGHTFLQDQGNGALRIRSDSEVAIQKWDGSTNENMAKFIPDGAVELYHDNQKKIETRNDGVLIGDSQGYYCGDGADMRMFFNGTDGFIRAEAGKLNLDKAGGEKFIVCNPDAAVELYYDNSKKLETTSTGVTVTGNVTGSLAANFTLVDFDAYDSNTQTSLVNDQQWYTDTGLGTRTISNYQRGQLIIIRAHVPMGIALSNSGSGANYAMAKCRIKLTNGSANSYTNDFEVWYRADGAGTHETTQARNMTLVLAASNTDFSNGDNLTVSVEGYRQSAVGSMNAFIGGWSSRKQVTIERYARQLA